MSDLGCLPTKPRRSTRELWERSALWHGIPKIGKSTLASQYPSPIFASTEDGLGDLDVFEMPIFDNIKRTPIGTNEFKEEFEGPSGWESFKTMLHDLQHREHNFQTLIVDTVDNLWLRCVKWHTVHHGVEYEHEGSLGFGKGAALIVRDFADTLGWAQRLPIGLILISHSEEKEYTDFKSGKKKTRVACTLPSRAMKVVNGMVDLIFYFVYEGRERVIKTRSGPNYDAGSRVGTLPETIKPLTFDAIVEAYTIATDGSSGNAKQALTERIHKAESVLSDNKIDSFDVPKRRDQSRAKHAGNSELDECTLAGLETYLQHLADKYRKGQTNGTNA
jgi:hypothetical protein